MPQAIGADRSSGPIWRAYRALLLAARREKFPDTPACGMLLEGLPALPEIPAADGEPPSVPGRTGSAHRAP